MQLLSSTTYIKSPSVFWMLTLMSSISLLSTRASASTTYYIDEGTSYSGAVSPCVRGLANLNTVTASLQTAMDTDTYTTFTGKRYANPAAWATDFMESCSGTYGSQGQDNLYADTAAIAVFAGHGVAGYFNFTTAHSGSCNLDFKNNMRLGSMNGAQGTVGIWLACDTLDPNTWGAEANWEWLQQQFGFDNTIGIDDNEPRDFFNSTKTSSNVNAWINEFNNGGRGPVAISYGDTPSRAQFVHTNAMMGIGGFLGSRLNGPSCGAGQPVFYYIATYVSP